MYNFAVATLAVQWYNQLCAFASCELYLELWKHYTTEIESCCFRKQEHSLSKATKPETSVKPTPTLQNYSMYMYLYVKQPAYSHGNYATEILMNDGHNCRVNYCGIWLLLHLSVRLLIILCRHLCKLWIKLWKRYHWNRSCCFRKQEHSLSKATKPETSVKPTPTLQNYSMYMYLYVKQPAYSHGNYATEILMNDGHNCRVNYCGIWLLPGILVWGC